MDKIKGEKEQQVPPLMLVTLSQEAGMVTTVRVRDYWVVGCYDRAGTIWVVGWYDRTEDIG